MVKQDEILQATHARDGSEFTTRAVRSLDGWTSILFTLYTYK
jgi:hypothetical protein